MKNSDIIIAVLLSCNGHLLMWGKTLKENLISHTFFLPTFMVKRLALHVCSWTNRFNPNLVLGPGCYLFHTADFYCCF